MIQKYNNKLHGVKLYLKLICRNKLTALAFMVILVLLLLAIFAPIIAPYPEQGAGNVNMSEAFASPSVDHIFGTDEMGRDICSRIIFGARISLSISLITIFFALLIAIPLGVLSGYIGGIVDEIIMRLTDVFLSFPPLLVAIVIASFLGPSLRNAMIAIVIAWWPWYCRLIRAQVVSIRERPSYFA